MCECVYVHTVCNVSVSGRLYRHIHGTATCVVLVPVFHWVGVNMYMTVEGFVCACVHACVCVCVCVCISTLLQGTVS